MNPKNGIQYEKEIVIFYVHAGIPAWVGAVVFFFLCYKIYIKTNHFCNITVATEKCDSYSLY